MSILTDRSQPNQFIFRNRNSNQKREMDQLDSIEDPQDRKLGQEEDLELIFDKDSFHEDQQLKDKILFAIQGLGGVRNIQRNEKMLQAYIKGSHCEDCVKDLVKFIRSDSPANPKARFCLANYNIIESDLIELLILQVEDKKLSFWLIALLSLMTAKPSDELAQEDKDILFHSLRQYKKAFIQRECFQILMVHIADFYKTDPTLRLKAHHQMLEFTILLVRNLAQIPDSLTDPHLHHHFIVALVRQDFFNPLLYILQNSANQSMAKLDIALLEICFFTFTCLDPQQLYPIEKEASYLKNVLSRQKKSLGVRHSRFMPAFSCTSSIGDKTISHTLIPKEVEINNQRKVPFRVAEQKRVETIESIYLPENFMQMQFEVYQNGSHKLKTVAELVFEVSKEFLEIELELLIGLVFENVYKESPKVSETNVIQYLLLCSWAIEIVLARYELERHLAVTPSEKAQVQFNFIFIAQIMQNSHFQLIYKILFKEATKPKKKQFRINLFHAGLTLFNFYLKVISSISISLNMSDRKNANVLMGNMFRHDIARILRVGFQQTNHRKVLSTLILICHSFFRLLSMYSDGKILTIQTNKLLKRKKQSKNEEIEGVEDFISEDESDGEGDNSYHQSQDIQRQPKVNPAPPDFSFQERKYNQKSQFAILAEYSIISKYVGFLKEGGVSQNDEALNEGIFFYIGQVKKLLDGEWLFFQAQTLAIFQQILSDQKFMRAHPEKGKVLTAICRAFIRLLQGNKLALVQSLFQYSNLSLKDQIAKNYAQTESIDQKEENMFTDE